MRWPVVVNWVVIILLIVIGVGVFTAPRSNLRETLDRQSKIEDEIAKLIKNFAQITGSTEFLLPMTQDVLDRVSKDYSSLHEKLSKTDAALRNFEERLQNLEKGRTRSPSELNGKDTESANDNENEDAFAKYLKDQYGTTGLEPITLPPELKQISDSMMTAASISDWEFDRFLPQAVAVGLVRAESPDAVPQDVKDEMKRKFTAFKTKFKLVDVQQTLYVETLIEEATAKGSNYKDLPSNAGKEEFKALFKELKPGFTLTRELSDLGIKRIYFFPYDDFPKILEFQGLWQNAKEHLVRDVSALASQR